MNDTYTEPQTVMDAAYEGPVCAVCGYPAPDKSRWARLGLIGLWKFGKTTVPLCWTCSEFGMGLLKIKDIVLGELRRRGIYMGPPTGLQVPEAREASAEPELGMPPGMPQGVD